MYSMTQFKFGAPTLIEMGESGHFIFNLQIDIDKYYCMLVRLPVKGIVQCHIIY